MQFVKQITWPRVIQYRKTVFNCQPNLPKLIKLYNRGVARLKWCKCKFLVIFISSKITQMVEVLMKGENTFVSHCKKTWMLMAWRRKEQLIKKWLLRCKHFCVEITRPVYGITHWIWTRFLLLCFGSILSLLTLETEYSGLIDQLLLKSTGHQQAWYLQYRLGNI